MRSCGSRLILIPAIALLMQIVFSVSRVDAQTRLTNQLQAQFEAIEDEDEEKLLTGILLQFSLLETDLAASQRYSRPNKTLARNLEHANGLAAIQLLDAHTSYWLDGAVHESDEARIAIESFEEQSASAELKLIYIDTLINRDLNLDRSVMIDPDKTSAYIAALRACDDEMLQHMFAGKIGLLLATEIAGGNTENVYFEDVMKIYESGRELTDDPYSIVQWHLISALVAQKNADLGGFNNHMDLAGPHIDQTGDSVLPTTYYCLRALYQTVALKFSGAADELEKTIPYVEKLNSDNHLILAHSGIADFRLKAGDAEGAGKHIIAVEKTGFNDASVSTLRRFFVTAANYYNEVDDNKNLFAYTKRLGSKKFVDRLKYETLPATVDAASVKELRNEVKETLQSLETTKKESIAARREANVFRSLWLTTLLLSGLGCLSLMLLYTWRRLSRTQDELTNEQQETKKQRSIREALEQKINRLQRMESLGLMAGGVAHDFNNLLVGVIGNAELIQMGVQTEHDAEFARERAEKILLSANKAAELSKQMLAYAGKQNTERKLVNIVDVASGMVNVLHSSIGPKVHVEYEPALKPEPLPALVDRTQIEQILLNLVSNSARFSSEGDTIVIRSGRRKIKDEQLKADSSFFGSRNSGGDFIYFEVEDSGEGISEEDLEHVFEPFFSDSGEGRGLGLAVVHGLVEAHDGLINIKSRFGDGTCIRVYLPRSDERLVPELKTPLPESKKPAAVRDAIPAQSLNPILVVDDDETIREWIKVVLKMEGYEVLTASSCPDAIDILCQSGPVETAAERFTCLVLDIQMPEMTGDQLLDALDECRCNLPVVMTSGYSRTNLNTLRARNNVAGVLVKPFETSRLISAIDNARAHRLKS